MGVAVGPRGVTSGGVKATVGGAGKEVGVGSERSTAVGAGDFVGVHVCTLQATNMPIHSSRHAL